MNWLKRATQDWQVSLECLCADDFGAGYKDENSWDEDDKIHYQNYLETKDGHQKLQQLAEQNGIEHYIANTDDRDSHHSDAYLYFNWSQVKLVRMILRQSGIDGDILDVPQDFPIELEKAARSFGWNVER